MKFSDLMLPITQENIFEMPGYYVWCGSMARANDGLYHLLLSRWPQDLGMDGWVTRSEICHAVASQPAGPYAYQGVALPGAGGDRWDRDCTHNPSIIPVDGKFYLYYMGNWGDGTFWSHRNNQRIGVAVADHPAGPWTRFDKPLIDVASGAWDSLMTSNPTCTRLRDGRFLMLYKGVGDGPMPQGAGVVYGAAFAESPLGPFVKHPTPVIAVPNRSWSVEDAFIWREADRIYCLVKDFHGDYTKDEPHTIAFMESSDGINWLPSDHPLAFRKELTWADGRVEPVAYLERPQIYLEDGVPRVLFCACDPDTNQRRMHTFNVAIPLRTCQRDPTKGS
ncbi:MAG: glycoside hydrolase family protein [Capsulimonadaceae bacterium]|nr:glycoside hydrolase family protein [Capsulimonadaceae bacterium]